MEVVAWGYTLGLTEGSFYFIPTIRYQWCNDCNCGAMMISILFGNIMFAVRRDVFDLKTLIEMQKNENSD